MTERVWVIERREGGAYTGSAGDILAGAAGQSYGNAFNWSYEMILPVGEKNIRCALTIGSGRLTKIRS